VQAVADLRRRGPVRFVTNTTSRPVDELAAHLRDLSLLEDDAELVTPIVLARRLLPERGHDAGILIAPRSVRSAYSWFTERVDGPAVLVGCEGHRLRIEELQPAVRTLLGGATLYALQRNRYFRKAGELVTDLGPLVAFLAYAADVEPVTLGKPSSTLFDGLAADAGVGREDIVMVGDDAEFDVSAVVDLGMRAVLVRTGKYRDGDEARVSPPPTAVIDSIAGLDAWLESGER
jgi:HAD superfamily hydrolase (TIGR01458 family)